jgi:DNA helicase-2/ATP-dependent DNA helicase PcrA
VLELLYGVIHFLPEFHDDPEGRFYLEVFTRQLTAMSALGRFEGRVVTNPAKPELAEASVRDLLSDWLAPIANGTVELDEEMIGSFPRNRLSILSIHQSKGLEFPLVLVDVGSDFKTNHWAHAFKRFPKDGGMSHTLEDMIRPLSGLGKPVRSATDRAFDDLERLYYVAFTRAQQVLVLVGLDKVRPRSCSIPNVASGWDRQGTPHGPKWPITYL